MSSERDTQAVGTVGSATNGTANNSVENIRPGNRRRRKTPPRSVWIAVGVCVLLIVLARSLYLAGDHAAVNIATGIIGSIAFDILAFWYLFRSGYSSMQRLLVGCGIVGAILGFFAIFRLEEFSGEMIPRFQFRHRRIHDTSLQKPVTEVVDGGIDLVTTTPDDFPQFLGPLRSGWIAGPKLSRDWASHPPRALWRQPIGAGWSAFSAVNGYAVTLEQRGENELVTCYEIETGKLIWSHAENRRHQSVLGGIGPRSTPTIHEGRVYTVGPDGLILCLKGSSGEVVWRVDLLKHYGIDPVDEANDIYWGRANSPLILDDKVIVPVGGKRGQRIGLAAFHKVTGELLWEGGDTQVSYSSPSVGELLGVRQVMIVNESNITGHDPENGQVLWKHAWDGNSTANANVSQVHQVADNLLFVSKAYGLGASLIELRSNNGAFSTQTRWHEISALKTKFTNVVIRDGFVYGLSDGILECIELANGKRRWKKGRYEQGQILGVDDVLLVQAESGDVAMVEATPNRFVELGKFTALTGKCWNNLCLYGNRLLVRNSEEAACYLLETQ